MHRVPPDAEFTLNDLAGSGGRMDAVAGVVTSAFLLSNGMRRDTEVSLLFLADPHKVVLLRMNGSDLKFLNPDERSTAALLKNSLIKYWARPSTLVETSPGIEVSATEPLTAIRSFAGHSGALWLVEDGPDPLPVGGGTFAAILSDPYDPSPAEREWLESLRLPRVSLGPHSLHASQCVTVLHNRFDTGSTTRAA